MVALLIFALGQFAVKKSLTEPNLSYLIKTKHFLTAKCPTAKNPRTIDGTHKESPRKDNDSLNSFPPPSPEAVVLNAGPFLHLVLPLPPPTLGIVLEHLHLIHHAGAHL